MRAETLRPYMKLDEFNFKTDHSDSRWIFNIADPSGNFMPWCLRLAKFTFNFQHKKRRVKEQDKSLSRLRKDAGKIYDPGAYVLTVYIAEAEDDGKTKVCDDDDFLGEDWAERRMKGKPKSATKMTFLERAEHE